MTKYNFSRVSSVVITTIL